MRAFILFTLAVLAGVARGEPPEPAAAEPWTFRETSGLCVLEQAVRDYGTVRFVGSPGGAVRLEVLGHRRVFADGPVTLYRVAPPWHPEHPHRESLGEARQRAGSGVLIGEPLATRVLMALYQGFEAHLQHAAWYGGEVDVPIANVHLRPRYEVFARCLRGAAAQGWSAFERTRIEHGAGAAVLSPADQARLRQVAEYVRADPEVSRVYVDGHSDSLGTPRGNLELSRRRAEAVATFLRDCGVPDERLVVRYHGAQYPVADNDDPAGRAENRRTTVRLERNWSTAIGEQPSARDVPPASGDLPLADR